MSSYDREIRERLRRERERTRRAKWLNGELRHVIASSHSSSAENTSERLHYVIGALSAIAGIPTEEITELLRGPEKRRPAPVVLPAITEEV